MQIEIEHTQEAWDAYADYLKSEESERHTRKELEKQGPIVKVNRPKR